MLRLLICFVFVVIPYFGFAQTPQQPGLTVARPSIPVGWKAGRPQPVSQTGTLIFANQTDAPKTLTLNGSFNSNAFPGSVGGYVSISTVTSTGSVTFTTGGNSITLQPNVTANINFTSSGSLLAASPMQGAYVTGTVEFSDGTSGGGAPAAATLLNQQVEQTDRGPSDATGH